MAANKENFKSVTKLVIDKLEGGYYNPNWHSTGDSRYGSSGETMFGIDRKAGGSINDTIAGKQFWALIDKNKTPKVWKWNYLGGDIAPQLKDLVADIMYPQYEALSKRYLTPQAKTIVDSDNRLLFHFIYGTWNGSGWFKKFATDINNAVKSGITDADKLTEIALNSRTKEGLKAGSSPNSLIAQGGNKIAKFIDQLKTAAQDVATKTGETVKKSPIITIVVFGIITASLFFLYKALKKK